MHVALVKRGRCEQVWLNTRPETIDASAYDGELVAVTGDVCPGMTYRDGVFLVAPPRVTADQIRCEAVRRAEGAFPRVMQPYIMKLGGDAALAMHAYLTGVHNRSADFLSLDAAPPDFQADRYWPRVPSLPLTSMPIATPMLGAAPAPMQPSQEVRVIVDHRGPVIEHVAMSTDKIGQDRTIPAKSANAAMPNSPYVGSSNLPVEQMTAYAPGAVALEIAEGSDLTALKAAIVASIRAVHDIHKGEFADPDAHNAWLEQLASFGAEVFASTTKEGVYAARDRAERFIQGG